MNRAGTGLVAHCPASHDPSSSFVCWDGHHKAPPPPGLVSARQKGASPALEAGRWGVGA